MEEIRNQIFTATEAAELAKKAREEAAAKHAAHVREKAIKLTNESVKAAAARGDNFVSVAYNDHEEAMEIASVLESDEFHGYCVKIFSERKDLTVLNIEWGKGTAKEVP